MKTGLGKAIELPQLFGPEMHENPYPVYQRLRETDPVHWDDTLRGWVLTRYDDVAWALKSLSSDRVSLARERFRGEGLDPLWDALAALMVQRDEPDHTRLRALVQKAFYRTSVEHWTAPVERLIRTLLAPGLQRGQMDFVWDFAVPLPILVISELVGIPEADRERVKRVGERPPRLRHPGLRGQPAPTRGGRHRPLLHPSRRPGAANRGHRGRHGPAGGAGQGPPPRHLRGGGRDTPPRACHPPDDGAADRVFPLVPRPGGRAAALLDLCAELGIGFVAYSPLGRGFLTGTITDPATCGAADLRRGMPRFQAENIGHNLALVARLKELADAERCSPAQLALAWVLSRRPFIVPIPGTRQARWLEENIDAAHLSPTAATLAALGRIFAPGAAAGPRYSAAEKRRVEL